MPPWQIVKIMQGCTRRTACALPPDILSCFLLHLSFVSAPQMPQRPMSNAHATWTPHCRVGRGCMRRKFCMSATIRGGHLLIRTSQSLSEYFRQPTVMRSHAYAHSSSAAVVWPRDQYSAASAARMSALPGARRAMFCICMPRRHKQSVGYCTCQGQQKGAQLSCLKTNTITGSPQV